MIFPRICSKKEQKTARYIGTRTQSVDAFCDPSLCWLVQMVNQWSKFCWLPHSHYLRSSFSLCKYCKLSNSQVASKFCFSSQSASCSLASVTRVAAILSLDSRTFDFVIARTSLKVWDLQDDATISLNTIRLYRLHNTIWPLKFAWSSCMNLETAQAASYTAWDIWLDDQFLYSSLDSFQGHLRLSKGVRTWRQV